MNAEMLLYNAGWRPGRRVEVDDQLDALWANGFQVVRPTRAVLTEFSGLAITTTVHDSGRPARRREVRIGAREVSRNAVRGWLELYDSIIGRAVTPIGRYADMTLMVDEFGDFWGGCSSDYGLLGHDMFETIHATLVAPHARALDREATT